MGFGKKKKDEYSDIYGHDRAAGYEFTYGNRKISKSRAITARELKSIGLSKSNGDNEFPLVVKCRSCGVYMDFAPGHPGWGNGKWRCPRCGVGVQEQTAYSQLERENDTFLTKWDIDEDYDEVGYDPDDLEFDWSDL